LQLRANTSERGAKDSPIDVALPFVDRLLSGTIRLTRERINSLILLCTLFLGQKPTSST
jgi:hypothetical protein